MAQKPTIAFRVRSELKDKWETAVEENDEYDSLSHLVRLAVEKELSDAYNGADGSQTAVESDQIEKVMGAIGDLEDTLGGVKTDVGAVRREVEGDGPVPDEIVRDVYSVVEPNPRDATRLKAIAERADVTERDAELALAVLRHDMGAVERDILDSGQYVYFRSEGEPWR